MNYIIMVNYDNIKYANTLYGTKYQNTGIFSNINPDVIEEWRDQDKAVIKEMETTIKNIEQYLDISDRKVLALKCGAFLIDDGYDSVTDKIWKGKGVKAITINDYNNLNTEEKQKAVPVCPGDELQYYGAFGLNWAIHTGIYMGTDNANKFGKMIEVDSHIQPKIKNRVYSLALMMALGYICASINCYRNLDGFTHHYVLFDAIENGPRRPTSIVKNINKYSRKEILDRSIKALKIKIWEYNIQTANCETFTKFIVSGEWIEDKFFYVRILENLVEAYLKDYKNSNEITDIYKLLIIIFNKTKQNEIQDKIFVLLKNINKKLVENGDIEFKDFFQSLDNIGIDLINNKNQIKKYINLDVVFNNSNGEIKVDKDSGDLNIQNATIINKESKYNQNNMSYKEILNNQDILINELKKINKKIDKIDKKTQLLGIINKLIDKIN